MVNFNVKKSGEDFRCDVHVEGEIPQKANVTLSGCDLHVEREPLEYMEAEDSMSTQFRIFDRGPDEEIQAYDKRLKKAGGESLGSVDILWGGFDYDMRVNHFKIDDNYEGMGLGTTMLYIVYGLAEMAGIDDMHFWIGGGQDTIDWIVSHGVPREAIETTTSGNLSTTVSLDGIDYDRDRLSVDGPF